MMTVMRLFAVLLILLPGVSSAYDTDMAYLSFGAHTTTLDDSTFIVDGVDSGDPSFDLGGGFSAALGYYLPGSNFRVEGEYIFSTNAVSTAVGTTVVDGDWWSHSGMFNLYYDFSSDFVAPYIGIGVGVSDVGSKARATETAYQFMVGASLNNRFYAGYRYFMLDDPVFDVGSVKLQTDYKAHIFEIGYRFTFGGARHNQDDQLVYEEESEEYEYMPDSLVYEPNEKEIRTTYDGPEQMINFDEMRAQANNGHSVQQNYSMTAKQPDMFSKQFFVQAGVFGEEGNVKKARYMLSEYGAVSSEVFSAKGKQLYKIKLGPYSDESNALYALQNVVHMGYKDAFIIK